MSVGFLPHRTWVPAGEMRHFHAQKQDSLEHIVSEKPMEWPKLYDVTSSNHVVKERLEEELGGQKLGGIPSVQRGSWERIE